MGAELLVKAARLADLDLAETRGSKAPKLA